jgi:hypothetical protein
MSALGTFLESKKIKPEALRYMSARLEARSAADHALVAARRERKAMEKPTGEPIAKPKTGAGLTKKQLAAALAGQPISRLARAKALRSATAILEKAKQPAPTLKDLFGEDKARKGKKKVVAAKK